MKTALERSEGTHAAARKHAAARMAYSSIALDIEGTLLSNALRPRARPGLGPFMDFCNQYFTEVVLFTAVPEFTARKAIVTLVESGHMPPGSEHLRYINWSGLYKDLRFVSRSNSEQILIVDDSPVVIHPDQLDQWIQVKSWEQPFGQGDRELFRARSKILSLIGAKKLRKF